jgi:hypothetical protein
MTQRTFDSFVLAVAAVFLAIFVVVVLPAFVADPDVVGAFGAGFVNPYASGYSADTIACWVILSAWILHERGRYGVRHGLWCMPLGVVPGVAVAFALYLVLRLRSGAVPSIATRGVPR